MNVEKNKNKENLNLFRSGKPAVAIWA